MHRRRRTIRPAVKRRTHARRGVNPDRYDRTGFARRFVEVKAVMRFPPVRSFRFPQAVPFGPAQIGLPLSLSPVGHKRGPCRGPAPLREVSQLQGDGGERKVEKSCERRKSRLRGTCEARGNRSIFPRSAGLYGWRPRASSGFSYLEIDRPAGSLPTESSGDRLPHK
jgi:hypothetical protein